MSDEKDAVRLVKVTSYDMEDVSCATCRWAEARTDYAGFTLECQRDNDGTTATFRHHSPYPLLVKPEHGCVQWEGK